MFEKITTIYPELTIADFLPNTGSIALQNDSDGKGDYIKSWSHPDFPQPTEQQLAEIK
jgi:hypothetical protein